MSHIESGVHIFLVLLSKPTNGQLGFFFSHMITAIGSLHLSLYRFLFSHLPEVYVMYQTAHSHQ